MIMYVVLIIAICILVAALHLYLDKKVIYTNLHNRHVVVTGGSSGIGKAAAKEAASLGANVTVIGRDVGKLEKAVKEISAKCLDNSKQRIQYAPLDVTSDYKTIEDCFTSLETEIGPIFMLINCAGMCICGEFDKMQIEDIKQMIDLNYFGSAYPTRCVLPKMKKRKEGIIVFVSSEAALIGIFGYSAYSAGKWAVRGLAEAVSMEMVGTGVRMMLSFPPDTDTPGLKEENLTKPEVTKAISGTGGLHAPDIVGKQMIQDALVGKNYSVYSFSGHLLIIIYGGLIENASQILTQICFMSCLRAFLIPTLLSFHNLIRKYRKVTNESEQSQKTK
ncbi:hypothetical protein K1T71_001270 [Dendrolimus kikuchii]|uniref:Uncharacterized protein n=1 Tax=Dendrolimus kikuchii TaxID=765133 RepID=A0ACC1DHS7_9NEOP|nr:hypothetical protein K1T71_001270 [Dendrolimus kikuchii]